MLKQFFPPICLKIKIKTNQAIVNVNCPWLFFRYVNPMAVGEGWNPLFWLFLNNFFTATTHHSEKISTFLETSLYGLPSWYNKAVKKMSSSFLKFESKFTQSLIVNYSLKTTFLWMLLKTIIVDHTKRFPKRCLTSLNDVWLLWKNRLKKGQKMRVQPSPGL